MACAVNATTDRSFGLIARTKCQITATDMFVGVKTFRCASASRRTSYRLFRLFRELKSDQPHHSATGRLHSQ
jgi:hypothetical protein